MRDQILDSFSHRDFSIIVVGNKFDNVTEAQANSQVSLFTPQPSNHSNPNPWRNRKIYVM